MIANPPGRLAGDFLLTPGERSALLLFRDGYLLLYDDIFDNLLVHTEVL